MRAEWADRGALVGGIDCQERLEEAKAAEGRAASKAAAIKKERSKIEAAKKALLRVEVWWGPLGGA